MNRGRQSTEVRTAHQMREWCTPYMRSPLWKIIFLNQYLDVTTFQRAYTPYGGFSNSMKSAVKIHYYCPNFPIDMGAKTGIIESR